VRDKDGNTLCFELRNLWTETLLASVPMLRIGSETVPFSWTFDMDCVHSMNITHAMLQCVPFNLAMMQYCYATFGIEGSSSFCGGGIVPGVMIPLSAKPELIKHYGHFDKLRATFVLREGCPELPVAMTLVLVGKVIDDVHGKLAKNVVR
jgi:hypothetical protein